MHIYDIIVSTFINVRKKKIDRAPQIANCIQNIHIINTKKNENELFFCAINPFREQFPLPFSLFSH